jgi:type II protein arginine methyltransferase
MMKFCDASGEEAVAGKSIGYWLVSGDFVSSDEAEASPDPRRLGNLGFPREWPAAYKESAALKSLIGKKGRIAGKRVAVAGTPSSEERATIRGLTLYPLQSFSNAERAAERTAGGLSVVRGWAVFECLDRPVGTAFVAERYWWNALPDGKWVDLTPRPDAWQQVLLAEAVQGAPKSKSMLSALEAEISLILLEQRFHIPRPAASLPTAQKAVAKPQLESTSPAGKANVQPAASPTKAANGSAAGSPTKVSAEKVAAPLDYSKWKNIVDSDDEDETELATPVAKPKTEDYGVKDLMEGKKARRPLPPPDYLVGNTGGGGGTNCFLSICKLLDADNPKADGVTDNTHQLAQAFGKIFHCGFLDQPRQRFYKQALDAVPKDAFIIVLGLGSIIPFLNVARRGQGRGMLLDMSTKLAKVGQDLLKANGLASIPVVAVPEGLDKEEPVARAVREHVPADAKRVVILTEQMAHDLLSNGVVPISVVAHTAVMARAPKAQVSHIPQTIELLATPMELRTEKLVGFDMRPFNAFRHTTSNEKADFWWWPVRLDNQPNTHVVILGPSQTLCGFDLNRSPEITLDEVRRTLKMEINARGRCNGIAMWWTARCGELEYSTKPCLAGGTGLDDPSQTYRPEWKQPVHYLAGETAVFVGDQLEILVSITPRFTVRMMQQSPFSVEAPPWIKAPTHAKFSATMPLLPYHFVMIQDVERIMIYGRAITEAVKQAKERLGRRPRVLDAGCGIGLLGMTAALEGADVWLCEAVPIMRQMCREVVAVNASAISEKRGLVQLLPPMMSTRLQVGEDIQEKFDIIISEVMDIWCLGEGVVPTMRHAYSKLLADGGVMLPSRLVIFVQPLELLTWSQAEKDHKVKLGAMQDCFKPKFTPMRINQLPHRWLSDEPMAALEIDLKNVPQQPADGEPNLEGVKLCIRMGGKPGLAAKISQATIDKSGMLCGYGIWWAADLGNGQICTTSPSSPQRSWKQLVRWLDEPRFVSEGDEVQVLCCYNDTQVNVEDIYMPQDMVQQYQEQMQAEQQQGAATSAANVAKAAAGLRQAAAGAARKEAVDDDDDAVLEVD